MPSKLYNDNPTVSYTLQQFSDTASRVLNINPDDDAAFIRFVLCGEYENQGMKQVFIDPMQNLVDPGHPLTISRDYDSVLGIADDILIDGPISVFAVPHESYALKTSIHIQRPIARQGSTTYVDYHRIPNFEFGNFGSRHQLNLFFPRLWSPDRAAQPQPYQMDERERSLWYVHGLRPAIASLLGERVASEWPATYETERLRAQRPNGGYAWSTKRIPKEAVVRLADSIRLAVEGSNMSATDREWARDFFVLHTIRGEKDSSFHRVDEHSAGHYLEEFAFDADLSWKVPEVGEWYVDVAIQISSDSGDCLQWITSSHADVIQQALHISDRDAERISSINSSKYERDTVSHLTAVSGFRVVPGVRARGQFDARYVQAYATDKAVVYNPNAGHHAKYLTTKAALQREHPIPVIEGIFTIYKEGLTANASNARLEVRVPYAFATKALVEFDTEVLRGCLAAFTREEWWSFRMTRLTAISKVLYYQANAVNHCRFMPESLLLTAACVWLTNGLHARPEDGPAARRLMDAILPLTEADEVSRDILAYNTKVRGGGGEEDEEGEEEEEAGSDGNAVPYNPYGCVFLRRLRLGDAPRLRVGGRDLSDPAFKFWFKGTIEQVTAKYQLGGLIEKDVKRPSNKGNVPLYINWTGAPEPELFDLAAKGHTLPPPAEDGSDVEERSDASRSPSPSPTIDGFLSQLWRQFLCDITFKSPIPRNPANPPHLKLTKVQRAQGREDIYQNLVLSEVFNCVAYKRGTRDDWQRAFKWLFPERGQLVSKKAQNYPSCRYYKKWLEFINNPNHDDALIRDTRRAVWNRLRKWRWIPDAHQDRMWSTSAFPGFTRWPPLSSPSSGSGKEDDAAPRILLKEGKVPRFEEADSMVL